MAAHKRINTGIAINLFIGIARKESKKNLSHSRRYNATINVQHTELLQIYLERIREKGTATLLELCNALAKPKAVNFFEFAYAHKLKQFEVKKKLGALRRYESVLSKLKAFAGESLNVIRKLI